MKKHPKEIKEIEEFSEKTRKTAKKLALEFFNNYVLDTETQRSKAGMIRTIMEQNNDPYNAEATARLDRIKVLAEFMKDLKKTDAFDFEVGATKEGERKNGIKDYGSQIDAAITEVEEYSERTKRKKAANA
jgi:hypothetical protein